MPNAGGIFQQRENHVKKLSRIYSARAKYNNEQIDKPNQQSSLERKAAEAARDE